MTRFDVARTQQPKSTAAYGSLRFGPLRYQLKRTIGMLPTPDNSECSRQSFFSPLAVMRLCGDAAHDYVHDGICWVALAIEYLDAQR
ncbi:hypothetical protein [Tateyamaria sp.]|uniref:hypothetical protein n=1 Tax=Tateyamaria sp. TaxID=1929288 RepID=UPI003B218E24